MNALNTSDDAAFQHTARAKLLGRGLETLDAFAEVVADLRASLTAIKSNGDDNAARRSERMIRQLDAFEPSVTMIGQIKSGKTSLVNAMIGRPDMLPADVNPWTSVVTSLHLHPEVDGFEETASFRFFDEDEWDKLISGGGRIGELASRAGADDELEKIKRQVAEMREKSRARLGRKFEVLLGQQRDYGYVDKDLVERFVCLGDDLEEDEDPSGDGQGRFADITKSAELSIERTSLPTRLCLRDTPGVNDTFMMREQITIRAIRDSRICVVVLSAHQALTSTDMALIRLISHLKSRDVILFVNRVDELSDPTTQIPQIEASIADTLLRHKGPKDAEVIFGSALWAQFAFLGQTDRMPPGSAKAFENWSGRNERTYNSQDELCWQASGLPALQKAVSERIAQGVGSALVQRIAASARNLASGLIAAETIVSSNTPQNSEIDAEKARAHMTALCTSCKTEMTLEFDNILSAFAERMERVQDSFLDRATASMIEHLETQGEATPWTYDPAGLRVLLSAAHKVLARNSQAAFDKTLQNAAGEIEAIYLGAFGVSRQDLDIVRPRAPQVPAPVTLGRTIALDLSGSWWKRWWMQRRGYRAYAEDFYELIKSETRPLISELRDDLAQNVREDALEGLDAFLSEQRSVFDTLMEKMTSSRAALNAYVADHSPRERRAALQQALATLNEQAMS
ncbi:MAG: dynamin family protein [Pseudomonadota bacterium]